MNTKVKIVGIVQYLTIVMNIQYCKTCLIGVMNMVVHTELTIEKQYFLWTIKHSNKFISIIFNAANYVMPK